MEYLAANKSDISLQSLWDQTELNWEWVLDVYLLSGQKHDFIQILLLLSVHKLCELQAVTTL